MIHRLTYRRRNHDGLHVRGYKENGTTTTPFDMVMINDLDRYRLVIDVIDYVPSLGGHAAMLRQRMVDARHEARAWTRCAGEDIPEVANWRWPAEQRRPWACAAREAPATSRTPSERVSSERGHQTGQHVTTS